MSSPARLIRLCTAVADGVLEWQRRAVGLLVAITVGLILLNVVTRSLQMALFWVDELAVYTMIWAFMLGAAATVRTREGIAVELLRSWLGERNRRRLRLVNDLLVLCFAVVLLICNWLWFDPVLLLSVKFEMAEFIRQSFNFVYRDPTSTLGIAKAWVWAVMPLMAVSLFLFSVANCLDSVTALRAPEEGS